MGAKGCGCPFHPLDKKLFRKSLCDATTKIWSMSDIIACRLEGIEDPLRIESVAGHKPEILVLEHLSMWLSNSMTVFLSVPKWFEFEYH